MVEAGVAAEGLVVSVVPDLSGLDRAFRYLVPHDLLESVVVGAIVRVPLRGRKVRAWVTTAPGPQDPGETATLREIIEVVSSGPAPALVALAEFAAWRYVGPVRPFLSVGSPPRIVKQIPSPRRTARSLHAAEQKGIDASLVDATRIALGHTCAVLQTPPAASRLSVIETVCAETNGDVLVLVPELDDAALVARQLRQHGHNVALVPDDWVVAAGGFVEGGVVVGTRSAAFAPTANLAAIVVIDADAQAYVSQRAPTWNAAVLCVERARQAGVPCVLTSPAPSLETLSLGVSVGMERSEERAGWPVAEIVDRKGDDPRTGLYGEGLARAIHRARTDDPTRPVICVLNRIGRARLLACAVCGDLARCEYCGGAMAQSAKKIDGQADELVCSQCEKTRPVICVSCGSTRLKSLRVGVGRVREELAALTGLDVVEVSSAVDDDPIVDAPVIIGTEAVLHRRRSASLVVFLDFDQQLLAPRFRGSEQALLLLALAGRLVGGRSPRASRYRAGARVVIQTRLVDHEVLVAAVAGDPDKLSDAERERRALLRLPPFVALGEVEGDGAAQLCERLQQGGEIQAVQIDSGTPDKDRFLVRAANHDVLCNGLVAARSEEFHPRVEIDPIAV